MKIISTALFLALTSVASLSNATIPVNFTGSTVDGSAVMTIDNAEFAITADSDSITGIFVAIDDAFASDPGSASIAEPNIGGSMNFLLNGTDSYAITAWREGGLSIADVDTTDQLFGYTGFVALSPGDTISLSGTLEFNTSEPSFNLPASGDYELFLVAGDGSRISENAVPEPSTVALLAGLGALGFALYRRRK